MLSLNWQITISALPSRRGDIGTRGKDFPIRPEDIPGAIPRLQIEGKATLRIRFQGVSRRGSAKHVARITFNNHRLGREVEWKRQASHTVTRDILKDQQNLIFHDTTNYMRLEAFDDNDTRQGLTIFTSTGMRLSIGATFKRSRITLNLTPKPNHSTVVKFSTGLETSLMKQ